MKMLQRFLQMTAMCCAVVMCGCVSGRFQAGTDEPFGFQRLEKKYCIENIDFSVDVGVNVIVPEYQGRSIDSAPNLPAANNMPWLAYKQNPSKFISGIMRQMPDVFSDAPDAERISLSCRITSADRKVTLAPFIITLGFLFPMAEEYGFNCDVSVNRTGEKSCRAAQYRTRLAYWVGEPWTLVCYVANPPASSEYSATCVFNITANDAESKEESIMYRTFAKAVLCAIESYASVAVTAKPLSTPGPTIPAPATPMSTPSTIDKLKQLRDSGAITQQEFLGLIERIARQQQGANP